MLVIDMNDVKPSNKYYDIDLRETLSSNRLVGLWRMLKGYYTAYFGAESEPGSRRPGEDRHVSAAGLLHRQRPGAEIRAERPAADRQAAFVLLAAAEGGFTYLSGRLAAFTAEGITLRLRNYLFDHIQRLTFQYHDKTPTGELIQRSTSDVDAVRRFYAEQAIGMGRILMLFLINFIAISRLNPSLGLISIIVVPVILVTSIIFFKKLTKVYEAYQEQDAILSTTLQENLDRGARGQGVCPPGFRAQASSKKITGKSTCAASACW